MADGYRILESGDLRVSESGDTRLTEKFYVASSLVASSSSISPTASVTSSGASSLSNVGSAIFAGFANRPAAARLNSLATLQPDADLVGKGVTSLLGTSAQASSAIRIRNAESTLAATGTLASEAGFKFVGEVSGVVTGTLDNTALNYTAYAVFDNEQDNIIRLTESGDIRVTEDGLDTRISVNVNPNVVYCNIVSDGVLTPFEAVAYIKENGVWEEFDPYVKWGGTWSLPDKIYKNISENWKRVY